MYVTNMESMARSIDCPHETRKMSTTMKLSKINIDQLACTRIFLRNVEPKLDSLYTLLLVASDCKGKVHLSQNIIADILKVKNGRISKMFSQLSNLNLLAKDYIAPNGSSKVTPCFQLINQL
jgi:hypothetical protein